MSKRSLEKPVQVTVCDYCNEEIDKGNSYQWAHIVRAWVSPPQRTAKWFRFLWRPENSMEEIEYDFHCKCFDLMVKTLKPTKD